MTARTGRPFSLHRKAAVPPLRHGGPHMEAIEHPRRVQNPHCARLVEVARRIVERLPDRDVKGAFLFGSAAWGDADAATPPSSPTTRSATRDFGSGATQPPRPETTRARRSPPA